MKIINLKLFDFIFKVLLNIERLLRVFLIILRGVSVPLSYKIDSGYRFYGYNGLTFLGSGRLGPSADVFVISDDSSIKIKNNSYIGRNFHIVCLGKITIGENFLCANDVFITNCSHGSVLNNIPFKDQPLKAYGDINIGNNVWLCERVSIIGGITIGDNVVVGINEIVTIDIPSNSIYKNGTIHARNS